MPKVSVIIPTYNRSSIIERAVNSILSQSYKDFELIVVDDGSTDNTREVINKYKNKIKYQAEAHQGIAFARNSGLKVAGGDYIVFCADDDILRPTALAALTQMLDKYKDTGLVYADMRYCLLNGQRFVSHSFDFDPKLLELDNYITLRLFRRKCIDKVGFFDEARDIQSGMEDWDYILRLSDCFKIEHLPKVLGEHFMHQDNLSSGLKAKNYNYVVNKRLDKIINKKTKIIPFAGYYLGLIHRFIHKYKGKSDEGIYFSKGFTKITPDFSEAYIAIGLAYLSDHNLKSAIEAFNKAKFCSQKNWKDNFNLYRLLSFAYTQLKDRKSATKFAKKSLEFWQDNKFYSSSLYDPILTVNRFLSLYSWRNHGN